MGGTPIVTVMRCCFLFLLLFVIFVLISHCHCNALLFSFLFTEFEEVYCASVLYFPFSLKVVKMKMTFSTIAHHQQYVIRGSESTRAQNISRLFLGERERDGGGER